MTKIDINSTIHLSGFHVHSILLQQFNLIEMLNGVYNYKWDYIVSANDLFCILILFSFPAPGLSRRWREIILWRCSKLSIFYISVDFCQVILNYSVFQKLNATHGVQWSHLNTSKLQVKNILNWVAVIFINRNKTWSGN